MTRATGSRLGRGEHAARPQDPVKHCPCECNGIRRRHLLDPRRMPRPDLATAGQPDDRTADSRSARNLRGPRDVRRTLHRCRPCGRADRQQRRRVRARSGVGWSIPCARTLLRHRPFTLQGERRRPRDRMRDGDPVDLGLNPQPCRITSSTEGRWEPRTTRRPEGCRRCRSPVGAIGRRTTSEHSPSSPTDTPRRTCPVLR